MGCNSWQTFFSMLEGVKSYGYDPVLFFFFFFGHSTPTLYTLVGSSLILSVSAESAYFLLTDSEQCASILTLDLIN